MGNLSVKARLSLMLGILSAALIGVGLLGMSELRASNARLEQVFGNNLMSSQWVAQMMAFSRDNVIALDEALLRGDAAAVNAYKQQATENKEKIDALWQQYLTTPMAPGEKEIGEDYQSKRSAYRDARNSIADDLAAGHVEQARQRRVDELQPYVQAMFAAGQQLLDLQTREAKTARQEAVDGYRRALAISLLAMSVGAGLALLLGVMLVRSMTSALHHAVTVSEHIAAGELGHEIAISSQDEFGRLLQALKTMDGKLTAIVSAVHTSAATVGDSARQLAQGNDDLSQRTQEQASALEETAASMEEMTATVKHNADNARQANQLGGRARNEADRGGDVVGRATHAMQEINASSRKIADIINVIDEIAFQTNLLALNAAVEAARAGEQGRGFAVVASEVRQLAQRSAGAAKEIKELIGDSVEKVKAGSQLVDASGKVLHEIVASVKKVTDIVAEIAAASDEQAAGIDQVNQAVTQMDSVTQQNAALVEQASAASKSMEYQAQDLVAQISFFRVRGQGTSHGLPTAELRTQQSKATSLTARSVSSAMPKSRVNRSTQHAPMRKASGDSWTEF